jgi:hypothetical protein
MLATGKQRNTEGMKLFEHPDFEHPCQARAEDNDVQLD